MLSSLEAVLPYGKGTIGLSMDLKNFLGSIAPQTTPPIKDFAAAVHQVLDHPVGSPSLDTFLESGDKVSIIVSDLTRHTGADLFLPHLINRMSQRGIPDKDITIVFALGIHRPLTVGEQRTIVGNEVAGHIGMENHNTSDTDSLVPLGRTKHGTSVTINRRVAEADKIILTGTIGFHYLAGFGGGRKSILPGVASYDGCVSTHLLVLNPEGKGRHPQARTGILNGNPMHEDMMEAGRLLPPKFLFNTVLSPESEVVYLAAGNWETAFYQGCEFMDRHYKVRIPTRADLVIVSCGGHPKDINFIQAHKTFDYAMNAVNPGGVMILAAACPEGLGHSDFCHWLRFDNLEELEGELRNHFQINGQTAYATLLKAKSIRVFLVSELPESVVRTMSIIPARSIEEALSKAYQAVGSHPSTYVIPYGSVTVPWCDHAP